MVASLLWWQWLILILPILPNLWSIWHVRNHYFATEEQKSIWFLVAVFIPVIGGFAYIAVGRKRASKSPLQQDPSTCKKDEN